MAQTQQFKGADRSFKIVIIYDGDHMTKEAQQTLRRLMEKYTSNIRLIICSDYTGSIIEPIKSRCLILKTQALHNDQVALRLTLKIANILKNTATSKNLHMDDKALDFIASSCSGNLRVALLKLELASFTQDTYRLCSLIGPNFNSLQILICP